jgi:Uma2 family endonuclease
MPSAKPQSEYVAHGADATVNGAASVRRLHLKPSDAGREVALEDFEHATGQEGWRYELIDGRIEVSPAPDAPHDDVMEWLTERLRGYRDAHPEAINKISTHARVYISGRRAATCPEPDLAAYRNYPLHTPIRVRNWRDVSPILVVETLSQDSRGKDLVRNVSLYLEVPSIREYWLLDPRDDADHPSLRVYRRRGQAWQRPIDVPFGAVYTTRLLPGFSLLIDPNA